MEIDLYGLGIGIRSNDPAVLEQLPHFLPLGWKSLTSGVVERQYSVCSVPRENGSKRYFVQQGPHPLEESDDLPYALEALQRDVELFVTEHAQGHVFVHAGVVGCHGRAILIPGRSFSGKSSLVAALCHAGATYYSDEYAVIDPEGLVAAYPRSLHLRREIPNVPLTKGDHQDQAIDRRPLPIALIVMTRYDAQAVWNPRPMEKGQALLELMANTMSAQRQPQKVFAVFERALRRAQAIQSARAEASAITAQLLNYVKSENQANS